MARLDGKAAIVTGGARGIGAAIARRLAAEGADVALTYVSRPDAAEAVATDIRKAGRKAETIRADAVDPVAVARAVDDAAERLGRLDILVNNAGIFTYNAVIDFTLEEFDRLLAVNVRSVFTASQAAVRHLGEGGRIITIGSVNGSRAGLPGVGVYAMTKFAVAGLTRGLARDLGTKGITVNVVQPGPIDTDLNPADGPFAETLKSTLAIPRYGHADEVAAAVAYLASPEAAYVTGSTLEVDGGFLA